MNDTQTLSTGMMVLIYVLIAWSAVWKGLALWKAGKLHQKAWFIVMFILNTAGILEIIYLLTHREHHHEIKPDKAE